MPFIILNSPSRLILSDILTGLPEAATSVFAEQSNEIQG